MIHKKQRRTPLLGVAVLIQNIDSKKYVICRRSAGTYKALKWCLPCGYVNFGEHYVSAAVREVYEETGLSITPESIFGVYDNIFGASRHTVVIAIVSSTRQTILRAGGDVDDVVWVSSEDLKLHEFAFQSDYHFLTNYDEKGEINLIPIVT